MIHLWKKHGKIKHGSDFLQGKIDLRKRKNESKKILKTDEKSDGGKNNNKRTKTTDKLEKEKINKLRKKLSLVTREKLTGKVVDGIDIDNNWDTTVKINYLDSLDS